MRWASLLLGFVVGLVAAQTLKFPVPQGQTIKATVVSVTDGDTIKVRVGNELQTVRIIGYDSPELNQNFGDKAFLYIKTLLEGREVILESDVQATDKYGRRLYHVLPCLASSGFGRRVDAAFWLRSNHDHPAQCPPFRLLSAGSNRCKVCRARNLGSSFPDGQGNTGKGNARESDTGRL
jgi:hypothetical protein